MKVKCIDNRNVEKFLTQGKEYEVENSKLDQSRFIMIDDTLYTHSHNKSRFEVVPSIDDVIKDKEKEQRANAYQKIIDYKNQNEEKRTMNGLEAINFMQNGGMVIYIDESGRNQILKFEDTLIHGRYEKCDGWFRKTFFELDADYEEYIEPRALTGWERTDDCLDKFYYITPTYVVPHPNNTFNFCDEVYDAANYFSTKEKAEEINFKQTLFRKLQRFSDENGGNEIDWSDTDQLKYGIFYNSDSNRLLSDDRWVSRDFGQVYFISEEVAEKAIELFHDDLIKYFTGDFGGDK